jgi:hypothetical protein
MKLKFNSVRYLSLTLFLLSTISLSLASKSDLSTQRHISKSEKETKQEHPEQHSTHHHHLKTRKTEKAQSPPKPQTYQKQKDGYFTRTSKDNQGAAAKALSAFVCGIILFIVSIHFICWNERRAVKDTQYIDFIRRPESCSFIENGKEDSLTPNRLCIVTGKASVSKEAKINGLEINIATNRGKICIIKTHYEKFAPFDTIEKNEFEENEEGLVRVEEKIINHRRWETVAKSENSKFCTEYHPGEVQISGKYLIPMKHLESLIDKNQCEVLADNKYIYFPTQTDLSVIEEYLNTENNDSTKPYKYIIRGAHVYILRADVKLENDESFDPEKYEFSSSDLRLSFKYYFLPHEEPNFTAVGQLSSPDEKTGLSTISTYMTNLNKAGCSYFCCCCADSSEKYDFDQVYTEKMTREEIVKKMEDDNTSCTWVSRIGGFFMHFLSIYLILYPLILLVGMIPLLGAIGATVLIFFAFILSLMTFLFIIACAWVCARPVYAVLIFGFIFILFILGKASNDHIKSQQEANYNSNYNGYNNNYQSGNNYSNQGNQGRPKRHKFL